MKRVTQQPTLDTNAYAAGDAVGGLLTFDFGKYGNKTVVIDKLEILDDASTPDSAELELHLFTDPNLAVADSTPFTISQAEWEDGKYLGSYTFTTYAATRIGDDASAVISSQIDINDRINLINGVLYGQLVCTGTPTFSATQLVVAVQISEYA